MSHKGWKNLRTEQDVKALERHYREVGYSHGYALMLARSRELNYQQGYRAGRQARREFDEGTAA